jgi:DNA-binding NarL/FixJ family response regulator
MFTHLSVQFALYARTRLEREALETIVIEHCHARATRPFEDLASAIVRAGAGEAEILIADLSVADATVDAHCLHALATVSQRARVILIISDSARTKEFRPLLERADGCMTREEGAAVLADAVACVLADGTYTSSGAARLLNASFADISKLALGKAPERHQEARCLLARGVDSSRDTRERHAARRASCSEQQAIVVNF